MAGLNADFTALRHSDDASGGRQSRLEASDAASLYADNFAAPEYLVPQILLAGHLTMLAGKPKSRKTWIALELALAVVLDRPFLGRSIGTPGRVLFCELDDDRRQLNRRLHLLLPRIDANSQEALKNLMFVHSAGSVRHRLIEELDELLFAAERCGEPFRLLVIDPYLAIRSNRKKADWVTADYDEIGDLRRLCAKHGCTGILVHHLRKMGSRFASDNVLGTTGLTAAVDAWWIVIDDPIFGEQRP
jgi:RecA-family ATPase